MSAGQRSSGRNGSTASWLEPESNQTSRMSRSRSKTVPPQAAQVEPFGQELFDRTLVPCVGAVGVEDGGCPVHELRREVGLAARGTVDRRNRDTPGALPRDAPVRAVGHHAVDAVAAGRRHPAHLRVDGIDSRLPQRRQVRPRRSGRVQAPQRLVHRDEPLCGRQEDDRVVAAPAMRIRVVEGLPVPEPPTVEQSPFDGGVGVEDACSAEELDVLQEVAARPDRGIDLQAVLHARS